MIILPVCSKCEVQMRPHINGTVVVETFGNPPAPYKLYNADEVICPNCGIKIVTGFGQHPYADHNDADFPATMVDAIRSSHVIYCHEKVRPITIGEDLDRR